MTLSTCRNTLLPQELEEFCRIVIISYEDFPVQWKLDMAGHSIVCSCPSVALVERFRLSFRYSYQTIPMRCVFQGSENTSWMNSSALYIWRSISIPKWE